MSEQETPTAQNNTEAVVQDQAVQEIQDKLYPEKVEGKESPAPEAKKEDVKAEEPAKAEVKTDATTEKVESKDAFDIKLPDGSLLTKDHVEKIVSYAKEQGLSSKQAQEMLNKESEAVSEYQESQAKLYQETRDKWSEASKSDKEIGGNNFAKNVEFAKRAAERFGTKEFLSELDKTGFGNHPEVIRVFARIGQAMGNDTLVSAHSKSLSNKSIEDVFYGTKE